MHLDVDQSVLARELALVAAAAGNDSAIPRLSRVCLEARDNGVLRLTVHNLEYGLASEVEALVTEPGAICLPAKSLLSLASALEGEIMIRTDSNDYATITAGRSRSRTPGEAADDFTELPAMPEGAVVSAETLVRLLSHVSFAVAKGEGRFEVPAALVRFTGDTLVCVATDGRRLALAQAPIAVNSPFDFLFPSEAMSHVGKLLEGQEFDLGSLSRASPRGRVHRRIGSRPGQRCSGYRHRSEN
jgi:DNA polymerase III subunit beta